MHIREIVKCSSENIDSAILFYKTAGRDFSFATKTELLRISTDGAVFLEMFDKKAVAVCGIVPLQSKNVLSRAVSKTALISQNAQVILPAVGNNIKDIEFVLKHCIAAATNNYYVALCPIKCGQKYLSLYLSQKLCVVNARPLYELRPYFILGKNTFAFVRGSSIILPYANIKAVSKMLDNKYIAVRYNKKTGEIKLVKENVE